MKVDLYASCAKMDCAVHSAWKTVAKGRGVSPEDGRQLALNLAIYAMTH